MTYYGRHRFGDEDIRGIVGQSWGHACIGATCRCNVEYALTIDTGEHQAVLVVDTPALNELVRYPC